MDGALKKKGISLSMQYLNETPLAQIMSKKMKKINIKNVIIYVLGTALLLFLANYLNIVSSQVDSF